jgi:hypothetical protein
METVFIMTVLILGFGIALALALGAMDLLFASITPAAYPADGKRAASLGVRASAMETVEK